MTDETLKKRAESASRGLSNLGMDDDADLIDALQAKVEELEKRERWIPVSAGLKCPSCDDVGWYVVNQHYNQPEGEQEQCQFCYECPDSVFNRRAALKQEGE